eukprot:9064877-Pyramimonas_sp.AAC.1
MRWRRARVLVTEALARTLVRCCAGSGRRWRQPPLPRRLPSVGRPALSVRGSSETPMLYVALRARRSASRVELLRLVRLPPLLRVLGFPFWVVALLEEVRVAGGLEFF